MTFIVIIARQTVIYKLRGNPMLFALFYIVAITILVLHFTGFLARRNLE